MKLLLDTQLLLWAAGAPRRLSTVARRLLADSRHELWFSAASLWEVTIKAQLGREDLVVAPRVLRRGLLENGYRELSITSEHAVQLEGLPDLHRDPIDRLLVAQAQYEGITLLTADERVASYPGPIRLV
jgi:PIN domain nuclease of toxin-antitoxin system